MKKSSLLTALLLSCSVMSTFAQITLSGKVINEKTGNPIEGANVRLEQTTIGCATNSKGEFHLKNITQGNYVLRASCLDYKPETVQINESKKGFTIKLKGSYIGLDQVVITGTGTHHKLKNAPVPVEIISANDLKRSGATNFKDAMNMLSPSFSFSTNSMSSYMTMSGMSNKYVLVLIDGQKLTGNIGGNTDLSRINISNIKRIEILKGAASSLYGSEAIGGVINIITDQPKDKISITSDTRYAQNNQFDQSASIIINKQKISSFTSFNHREADGWQLNDNMINYDKKTGKEILTKTDRQASEEFFSNTLSQRFVYTPNKSLSIYTQGSFYNKENKRPRTEMDYNLTFKDYNIGIGGKYLLKNTAYISWDIYNDNYEYSKKYINEIKDKKGTITTNIGESLLQKKQNYYNANIKGVFRVNHHNKITIGSEYISDQLKNPDALDNDKKVYTAALYSQDEITLTKKLQAVVGLRYVYHQTFKGQITPKATMMYSLGAINLRASYASGFRAPALEELYYNKERGGTIAVGNINLKPEKSNYYSINAEYFNKLFTLSATAYINRIADLIINKEVPLTNEDIISKYKKRTEYNNVDHAKIKGVDISLNSVLGAGISIGGSYSYADARNTTTNSLLPRSIKHSGTVNANWFKTWGLYRLNINVNGRIQGSRYEESQYGDAPKCQLWNLCTRHTFNNIEGLDIEPSCGIENVFNFKDDRPFNSNYATLSPGRTFYVGLALKFRK